MPTTLARDREAHHALARLHPTAKRDPAFRELARHYANTTQHKPKLGNSVGGESGVAVAETEGKRAESQGFDLRTGAPKEPPEGGT